MKNGSTDPFRPYYLIRVLVSSCRDGMAVLKWIDRELGDGSPEEASFDSIG